MKKLLFILLIIAILFPIINASPIPISNCQELQDIKNNLLEDYELTTDIDCMGFDFGDGQGFMPIGTSSGPFKGTLDGKGNTIRNLSINRPIQSYVGLFGKVLYDTSDANLSGTIKNLGLIDANIIGNSYVGGISGYLEYAGIYNSYVKGEIQAKSNFGALAGAVSGGIITNSYATGKVSRISGTGTSFGGLIGDLRNLGNVYNSYSTVEVSTGGGGLIGYSIITSNGLSNSFYDSNVSGKSDVGKGIPKTTQEMKEVFTYLNKWNLVDQWVFIPGEYPKLRWQKDVDFSNAHQPDPKLKVDIAIVADTSTSMSSVWSTLCNKVSDFIGNLNDSEYDYRLTFYGMSARGLSYYCADFVTNQYLVGKYGLTGLMGYLVDDWPSNGDMVVQEHDWRENTDARILFLVGDNDGVNRGSTVYTPRCNRLVESALEKNVIVNTLMRQWTTNTTGASEIITTGTGGTPKLYGETDLLDLVEGIISEQVQYFPDDLNDVGQCQRGIKRRLPDGNWEILREPIFPTVEDNYSVCHDGVDNDCDGLTDSADLNCILEVSGVNIAPNPAMTMQEMSVNFDVNNPNGGQVECAIKETGVNQVQTGNNLNFNLSLGQYNSGSYFFTLFCSNGLLIEEKIYPFDVFALPDLSIDAIMSNSNPEVGDELEITSEIRNNGGINYSNVPIELVYTDMNGDTVEREIQNIDVGRNSSEVVVFRKVISTTGWKILEINIDPANIIEEEYEFNNTVGKLIYSGLFDPSLASAKIYINSIVYPNVQPIDGPGFLFVGKATYVLDGNNTSYPVAGAQIDITIDSNIVTDESPFAELKDWTQSDGNFVIPFNNPRVLADYNALIEVTDGTAYGFSLNTFVVDQNVGSSTDYNTPDYNTPYGFWDGNTFHCVGSSCGNGTTCTGNCDNGGPGSSDGGVGSCSIGNLSGSIRVDYPNIDFFVNGNDSSDLNYSIADKTYRIVIVLNGQDISFTRTGLFSGLVYSGVIDSSMLPQTASIYVDPDNWVNPECSEYDNYSQVDLKGPNIKAKSIEAGSYYNKKKLLQGEVTKFTLVMENTGSSDLNNVLVTFSVDNNVLRSYVISSIAPNQKNTYVFEDVLNSYGLTRFTLDSNFIDSDMNDNRFSKLFKVLIPDYYVHSYEDGPLIVVNPIYPTVGQRVDINATVKSNDLIHRDASVPVELFADGLKVSTGSVLFPNGKNFAFAQIDDFVAPMLAKTVSMGIYINRALRQYEENFMNNYVTFPLFVKENPLLDANVLLLRMVDDELNFVVEKSLNTKFLSDVNVLSEIIDYINNSIDLKVDSLSGSQDIFRIRVDVDNEQYFSNYFLVNNVEGPCGDVVIPDCEKGYEPTPSVDDNNCPIMVCEYDYLDVVFDFNGEWVEEEYPLNFYWSHTLKDLNYYVALDLWTTNNSSPLGSIEDTIQRLKEDYAWSRETRMDFVLPMHVYSYNQDFGELFYGGYMPKPFVFRVSAYLLDENFDLVGLIDEEEIVLEDSEPPVCVIDGPPYSCDIGFKLVSEIGVSGCFENMCKPIVDCWDEVTSPHPICTLSDLNRVREHLDWDYVLMNDINASETRNWNEGKGWDPIGKDLDTGPSFKGSFDGNNFVISGLYINRPSEKYVGLFGNCECNLNNVRLIDSEVIGHIYVGCLTGAIGMGRNTINCSVDCVVVGNEDVGGLTGHNNGVIRNSYSEGSVLCLPYDYGSNLIYPCVVGGLVGVNYYGSIYDSYSLADVNSPREAGGLVGVNHDYAGRAFVYNSYSVGKVNSFGGLFTGPGGLVGGDDYPGSEYIVDSYWDVNTSGQSSSSGGIGKLTSEMKSSSTFVDWNTAVWSIVEGEYPKFTWQ